MSDRTVHARYETKEIVRYDAGKWFLEAPNFGLVPAQPLTVGQAAALAADVGNHATVFFGLCGGRRFDRLVRDRLAHEHPLGSA